MPVEVTARPFSRTVFARTVKRRFDIHDPRRADEINGVYGLRDMLLFVGGGGDEKSFQ